MALAGQPGHEQEAQEMLQQFGSGSNDRLLELINGLSTLAEKASPPVRTQLAQLQLTALDRLESAGNQLDAKQRLRVEQVRAEALRVSGRTADALRIFKQLATDQPDNGSVQIDLAELLLESDDAETLSAAITQWQRVGRRVRPGTDDWFRARYSIALALYKRNQTARADQPSDRAVAAQRLNYLKATSSVDQSSWKAPVDELLQRCQQAE